MMYLGGLGPVGSQVWNQEAKQIFSRHLGKPFGGHFATFSVFCADVFLVDFRIRAVSTLWAIWESKGSQNEGFGRSFRCHFGDTANM